MICKACQESRHRMCEDPERCECPKAVAARDAQEPTTQEHLKRLSKHPVDQVHIRLQGLSQKPGQSPTELHVSIEEGGTTLDNGKVLWNGFISVDSFRDVVAETKRFIEN